MKDKRLEPNTEGTLSNLVDNVTRQMTARWEAKTNKETTAALRTQTEFIHALNENIDQKTDLGNAGLRTEAKRYKEAITLIKAEDEMASLEAARKKRAEPPAAPTEAEKIKAENERIKAEMEQLQLKLEQEKLKARVRDMSAQPKEPPKAETYAEKVGREFEEYEHAKLTILARAEKLSQQFPTMKEQIERDANKDIEALKGRRRQ